MRRLFLAVAAASLAGLAGCSPPEATHDVAYYRDHPDDRAARMKVCRHDPGRLATTPNCTDALAAESEAVSRKFWATPKPAPRVADPGKL